MSILDDDTLALEFYNALAPIYSDGILTRVAYAGTNEGGTTKTETTQPIKVQRADLTEMARAAAEYTTRDVRLLVLRYGVGEMDTNCKINWPEGEFSVMSCISDPAGAYWQVRARRVVSP